MMVAARPARAASPGVESGCRTSGARLRGRANVRPAEWSDVRLTGLTADETGEVIVEISVTVNGETRTGDVEPRTLLVYWLRDDLRLTGTNIGCDTSSCGACTVHVNGESVKSCTMLAVQADGEEILTIEGLAPSEDELHPMQEAFRQNHGLQCGYCTPGMVMAAVSLLEENPDPSERDVRLGLEGNLCRCTGYHNIVKSVLACAAGETAA